MEEIVKVLWNEFGAGKTEKRDLSVSGRERTVFVLSLIMAALANKKRREILIYFLKNKYMVISFKRLNEEFSSLSKKVLQQHLQVLQKAWLVNRTADLSNPRIQKDPYYSFYRLSNFGSNVLAWLTDLFIIIEEDYLSKR